MVPVVVGYVWIELQLAAAAATAMHASNPLANKAKSSEVARDLDMLDEMAFSHARTKQTIFIIPLPAPRLRMPLP
jgi:hypothetical protein